MARKDMENHYKENVENHLMMTNHELTVTKAQVAELTDTKATLTKTKNKLSTELTAANFWLAAALKKLSN